MGEQGTTDEHRKAAVDHGQEPLFLGGMVAPDAPVSAASTETAIRVLAYSQLLAAHIEREVPFIRDFRRDHLPHRGLLTPAELVDWIAQCAVDDGSPTLMLAGVPATALIEKEDGSYVLPKIWANVIDQRVQLKDQPEVRAASDPFDPPRLKHTYVWVPIPDSEPGWLAAEAIPIRLGGVLDELRRFALDLRQGKYAQYWRWRDDPSIAADQRLLWDEARIVAFVLTGYVPLLSEEQVPRPTGRGSRLQSAKHLQLAVFTHRNADAKLRDRIEAWNAQYPEWAYKETSNFGWDSLEAVRRLLNQPSEPRMSGSEWFERAFAAPNWQEVSAIKHVETEQIVFLTAIQELMRRKRRKTPRDGNV